MSELEGTKSKDLDIALRGVKEEEEEVIVQCHAKDEKDDEALAKQKQKHDDDDDEPVPPTKHQSKEIPDGRNDIIVIHECPSPTDDDISGTGGNTTQEDNESGMKMESQSNIPISRGLRGTTKEKKRVSKSVDRVGPVMVVDPSNNIGPPPVANGFVAMRGLRKNSTHMTKGGRHTNDDEIQHTTNHSINTAESNGDVDDTNVVLSTAMRSNVEDDNGNSSSSTRSLVDDDIRDGNNHHYSNSHSNNDGITTHLIQAYPVLEQEQQQQTMDQIRDQVRQTIIQDAVEANVVDSSSSSRKRKTSMIIGCVGGILLLLVLIVVFTVILPSSSDDDGGSGNGSNTNSDGGTSPMVTKSTLEIIRERRYVRCGVYDHAIEFSLLNPTNGKFEGINADQCRAIAIAVFGSSNAVEFLVVKGPERFQQLAEGKVDVLATTATHNFQRDVYFGKSTGSGFTFATPFVYSGMTFWGPPEYIHCAESFDTETGICQDFAICVAAFTSHEFLLRTLFPHEAVVPVTNPDKLVSNLDDGTCVVVAAENIYTNARRRANYGGVSSGKLFSNEPLALVTREDDHEWSSLVNSVINVFFWAEANGISKGNAEDLQPLVGSDLSPMLVPIIQELGNYGDLYELHLAPLSPRSGLNTLYTKGDKSGLLYAFSLGVSTGKGPEPDPNGVIARVLDRGHLKCGVVVADDRDAAMAGFDTEFCKALSAGLFGGSTEAVEVTEISATDAAFKALDEGEWDVAAGMRLHLLAGYREPTTGKGFSLSMPYYYDTTAMQAYGFVTTADDPKWSDLVSWAAMATIHAASMEIGQGTADQMPQVGLFGKNLNLFQDVVRGVGSYNEIYKRTLEDIMPQAGSGNELNHNLTAPQQFPLPFL